MTKMKNCQVLVVGAGPGGYVAAIRAGQLGLDTICVEGDKSGGTCLIRGCIPSKAMIHAATKFEDMARHADAPALGISLKSKPELDMKGLVAWKDGIVKKLNGGVEMLMKKAGVDVVHGWARFRDGKTCEVETDDGVVEITAEHVILATGSSATELPFMPYDGDTVISSTEALDLQSVPKDLVVVGGGYIGLELGIAYRKLGATVTVVEALERILPLYDKEMVRPIEQWLKKHDVAVHLSCKAKALEKTGRKKELVFEDKAGKEHRVKADKVLVTVGRKPHTDGWGIENMMLDMDGPFVKVDDQCRTSMRNVWAIGDLVGEPLLAHKAHAQGEMVAEIIAGKKRVFDPVSIAAVCFTEPEIVGVGLSPDEAKAQGEDVIAAKFPLAALGRALAMEGGADGGFIRVTARKSDHVVLGVHAVGAHVAELSGEFALAIEMGARLEDIAHTIHVHPTLTEGFMEAAQTALGAPVHIAK